jgi:hypothetical protein
MRKQERRPRACIQLAFHGTLILPQDVDTAPRRQSARSEIEEEFNLPWFEAVPRDLPAHQVAEEAFEAIEHDFPLLEIVCRGHAKDIGGVRVKL